MTDQKVRISRENQCVSSTDANGRYPVTPFGRVKPPFVNKVDGRARILRPLRPTVMQSNQVQPSTSTNSSSDARSQSNMHHSQSMPVLASGTSAARPSSSTRVQLTLPSNTTEKVPALLAWADSMKNKMDRIRQKARQAMEEATKDDATTEDLERTMEMLIEVAHSYNEIARLAATKCRMNAIYDKRGLYKSTENAINSSHLIMDKIGTFEKMQEAMDQRSYIEKNVAALNEAFRQNPPPSGIPRVVKPPPLQFSKHVEDANKGVWMAMDAVMNKAKGDPLIWRIKKISHPYFRNSKCLFEVRYCGRRPSGDKDFLSFMKAVIVLKYGVLEDLEIGGDDEDLYDQERIIPSKRIVYNEFTRSAKDTILCTSVVQCTSPVNFACLNNYIQSYLNCFNNKCYYCKKHLRHLMPPTVVLRTTVPTIAHKLCLSSQVPTM